jgi:hypothetical protein
MDSAALSKIALLATGAGLVVYGGAYLFGGFSSAATFIKIGWTTFLGGRFVQAQARKFQKDESGQQRTAHP